MIDTLMFSLCCFIFGIEVTIPFCIKENKKMSEELPSKSIARECSICQGMINLLGAQALSLEISEGNVVRVYFHPICFKTNPKAAYDALYKMVDKGKNK